MKATLQSREEEAYQILYLIYSIGALVLGGVKIQKPKLVHSLELLLELVITSEYVYSLSKIHHGLDIFKICTVIMMIIGI